MNGTLISGSILAQGWPGNNSNYDVVLRHINISRSKALLPDIFYRHNQEGFHVGIFINDNLFCNMKKKKDLHIQIEELK